MKENRKKIVYVIGHKNPDTDSVCSAIAYAHFKNLTDKRFLFIPARAGKLMEETRFVLDTFGVPAPQEIETIAATVSDLEMKVPIAIYARDSIQELLILMRERGVRSVPVINEHNRVVGIVGLKDIASHYMDSVGFTDLSRAPLDINRFLKTLNGRVITNPQKMKELSGKIFISSMQKGTIMNLLQKGDIVIAGDQHDILRELIHLGCSAVIVTDSMPVSPDIIAAAEEQGTLIISSPLSAFSTVQIMTLSEPVETIICQKIPQAGLFTPISEIRKNIIESEYRSVIVVDSDNRLIGIITRTDLLHPIQKKAILVDHNEISQAVDNVEEAEILEIIDHHRVGDISTVAPIYVYNDPVGSTCTVVAGIMFLYQIAIPRDIAGLLLSGILSDTLMLTLSTTTDRDREAAERLSEIAEVSIKKYGKDLLQSSINIKDKTAQELIAADFKEFVFGGKKFGVSQMMVLDCEEIDLRETELLDELERLRAHNNYDLTVLLVTNPLSATHERVLMKGEIWIVEKAFNVNVEGDTCTLPSVMSRKKDFIPALGQALSMGS